ncbi:MAG: hypothetical protein ACRD25_09365 [Terracidiphilus sp.]
MKLAALALAFAIGPLSLAAQSAVPAFSTLSSGFRLPAISSGCPVSMQLQQRLGNQLETVQKDGRVYKAPATQLMLTIGGLPLPGPSASFGYGVAHNEALGGGRSHPQPASPPRHLRAAAATATVYGFGGQPRAELVSPGPNSRGNSASGPARNLQLRFNANDGTSVAELWLPSFGAVRWLEIDSITWADGSNWKPAEGRSCTVSPSLFMLVGADSQAGRSSR